MPAKKKPQTIEEIRRAKRAPRKEVDVVLDDTETVTFVFKGIGRRAFQELSDEHSDEEQASGWNLETFPAALVAACCEEPPMTEAEAQALWDDDEWTVHELDQLFSAALYLSASYRTK
jgi:hypothetical protein